MEWCWNIKEEVFDEEELFQRELDIVSNRRKIDCPSKDTAEAEEVYDVQDLDDSLGVAFSGGGIRSAAFCLGMLRSLAHYGLLREVDYLSTVSGGGYTGTAYLTHVNKEKDVHKALTKLDEQMQENADYAVPQDEGFTCGTCGSLTQIFMLILSTLCGPPLLLTCASFPSAVVLDVVFGNGLRRWDDSSDRSFTELFTSSEFLAIQCTILGFLTLGCFVAGNICNYIFEKRSPNVKKDGYMRPEEHEPRTELVFWWNLRSTFLAVCYSLISVWAILLVIILTDTFEATPVDEYTFAGLFGFLLVATIFATIVFTSPNENERGLRVVYVISLIFPFLVHYGIGRVAQYYILRVVSGNKYTDPALFDMLYGIACGVMFIQVFTYRKVVKMIHNWYEWRLRRAFYANSGEDVDFKDMDSVMTPVYLCNTTVNDFLRVGVDQTSYDFFTISQHFIGSERTGYTNIKDSFKLSQAMAVSASAIAVTMGAYDAITKPLRWVLGFLSIGLGDWVTFPPQTRDLTYVVEGMALLVITSFFLYYVNPVLVTIGLGIYGFNLIVSFWPYGSFLKNSQLFVQMHQSFGHRTIENVPSKLYLSDGGHLENLAVYELFKRRCKTIFIMDGGNDPSLACDSLFKVLDKVQRMLPHYSNTRCAFLSCDEDINIMPDSTKVVDDFRLSHGRKFFKLRVHYFDMDDPTAPPTKGMVYYCKLIDLPRFSTYNTIAEREDTTWCGNWCGLFPYHSTALFNFSRKLFTKYADLGQYVSKAAVKDYCLNSGRSVSATEAETEESSGVTVYGTYRRFGGLRIGSRKMKLKTKGEGKKDKGKGSKTSKKASKKGSKSNKKAAKKGKGYEVDEAAYTGSDTEESEGSESEVESYEDASEESGTPSSSEEESYS